MKTTLHTHKYWGCRKNVIQFIIYGCIAVLLFSSSEIFAQTKNKEVVNDSRIERKVRLEMEWMQENLGLSMEQYDKVNSITYFYTKKSDSLDHIQNTKARKIEKVQSDQKKDAELKVVLNVDQYKTYISGKDKKHVTSKSPFVDSY